MTTQMASQKRLHNPTSRVHSQSKLVDSYEKSGLFAQLKLITHKLIYWLTAEPELIIKQKVDRSGSVYWYVYDPITERMTQFLSEEEVMIWIEECFYYQNRSSQDSSMSFYWH